MKALNTLVVVSAALHTSFATKITSASASRGNTTIQGSTASKGYIVQLKPGSSIGTRDVHYEFHRRAGGLLRYKTRHEFKDAEFFYGVSIDPEEETNIDAILALDEVIDIWPNRIIPRPQPVEIASASKNFASSSHNNPTKPENSPVSVYKAEGDSDVNSALKLTGVDAAHKLGFTGKGIKIGIIDSGIDYRHPALGGGFGKGFKVAGGYDFVGDDFNGTNPPVPDSDPLVSCLEGGHGTHVAGIIAGRDPTGVGFGLLGVAPDATLYAYRIFSCAGATTDDAIMQAFQMAATDGVDVISGSFGAPSMWETADPYVTLLQAIRRRGIGLVLAAGNDGSYGPYSASAPSLAPAAISVGSYSNSKFALSYNAIDSTGVTIQYARLTPLTGTYTVIPIAVEVEGCIQQDFSELKANIKDISKVIVMFPESNVCTAWIPWLRLEFGLKYFLFSVGANDETTFYAPGALDGEEDPPEIFKVPAFSADKIKAGYAKQKFNYTMTFNDQEVHDFNQPTVGTPSWYTTFGPTVELSLKPQLSAPGGTVLSTWPTTGGYGYAVLSGTSMATPHLSGIYALIKQSNPRLTPEEIAGRLQSTAVPGKQFLTDILSPTGIQGSGLVDVIKAMTYDTVITPTEFNLRDTATPMKQTVTIENKSIWPRFYTLGHAGAGEVNVLPHIREAPNSYYTPFSWEANINKAYATAKFTSSIVFVLPFSKATVDITISPPAGLDSFALPLYGGFITIKTLGQDFSLPYIGAPYKRNSLETLDTSSLIPHLSDAESNPPAGVPSWPVAVATYDRKRFDVYRSFIFPAPADSDDAEEDKNNPRIKFNIRQPSAYVRFDAVPVDTAFIPTHYGFDVKAQLPTLRKPDLDLTKLDNFLGVPSYGSLFSLYGGFDKPASHRWFQALYPGYGDYSLEWQWATTALSNGTIHQLPNADYRVLIRTLRDGYNYTDPAGYESWLSPAIGVNITRDSKDNIFFACGEHICDIEGS